MHKEVHLTGQHHTHHTSKLSWSVFFAELKKFLLWVWRNIKIWRLITYTFSVIASYIIFFELTIEETVYSFSKLLPPLAVYLFGTYLTPLSYYFVLPLLLVPIRISIPILGLVSVFSFFKALII